MLGGGQWGHWIGEVEVGSDAELALDRWRVWRGGCAQTLLARFLIDAGQIGVNQCIQELDNQLRIVWELSLLWNREKLMFLKII